MAIGRSESVTSFGRSGPPPEGKIAVRDKAASRAAAVSAQIQVFEDIGEEVPEHLAAQLVEVEGDDGDAIVLVDSDFPAAESTEPETEPATETETEPEPETEPAPEPEPEPEPEPAEEVIDYEEFTIPELKAELEALGVEYPSTARKADLISLVLGNK